MRPDDVIIETINLVRKEAFSRLVQTELKKLLLTQQNNGCLVRFLGIKRPSEGEDESLVARIRYYSSKYKLIMAEVLDDSGSWKKYERNDFFQLQEEIRDQKKPRFVRAKLHLGTQEHIIFDESKDETLRRFWNEFNSEHLVGGSFGEQVKNAKIYNFVRGKLAQMKKEFEKNYNIFDDKGTWLLGEIFQNGHIVCRPTAMLVHYLACKSMLHSRFRRGRIWTYNDDEKRWLWQGHDWNEIILSTGGAQLLDASAIDYKIKYGEGLRYAKFDKKPLYTVDPREWYPIDIPNEKIFL